MTDGFLLIDKEAGVTSNDVLTRLKEKIRAGHGELVEPCLPKVGHTGTLDPFATGLLVVAIGEAVKFISYLNEEPKVYEATLKLGEKTDTADLTGTVADTRPLPPLSSEVVASVLQNLVGEMDQIPPMYSAKKQKGKKLYELAREGIEIERKSVTITITSLEVIEISDALLKFQVSCSRGTYVRSLGETIAEKLGTVGHLVSLRRLRAGSFDVKNGVAVDGSWDLGSVLVPIEKALSHLPSVELSPEEEARIFKGQPIPRSLSGAGEAPISLLRNGHLVGIGECRANQLWPKRLTVFQESPNGTNGQK